MRYKKNREKIHTHKFLMSQKTLDLLDYIAFIEGQSRSVIIEMMLDFYRGKYGWDKCKRRTYRKKVYVTKADNKSFLQRSKKAKNLTK